MKTLRFIPIFLILLYQPAAAQEIRGGIALGYFLSPKVNMEIELQTRKISYPETCFNRNIEVKMDYSLAGLWRLSGSYGYSSLSIQSENLDENENENSDKHKFTGDLVFQPKRFDNDFKLTNRLRYQYSTVDNSRRREYLRNKITLDYKISKKMEPYIALEPYFNLLKQDFRYVRFYIGNELSFNNSKLEIYYITEARLKEENLGLQYIMGATYKFNYNKFKEKR